MGQAMSNGLFSIRGRLDRAGLLLSGLCALHCLLSIVLVGALGLGGQFLLNPDIHRIGLGLAIVVGIFTLAFGAVRHGNFAPLGIGAAGIALMSAALMAPHGLAEAALTIAGVLLVGIAHLRNLRIAV
jgi:MerC mercury resistance protein